MGAIRCDSSALTRRRRGLVPCGSQAFPYDGDGRFVRSYWSRPKGTYRTAAEIEPQSMKKRVGQSTLASGGTRGYHYACSTLLNYLSRTGLRETR